MNKPPILCSYYGLYSRNSISAEPNEKTKKNEKYRTQEFLLWCSRLRIQCCLWGSTGSISSLVQCVKDLTLLQLWWRSELWLGFNAWLRKFHMPWVQPKEKIKNRQGICTYQEHVHNTREGEKHGKLCIYGHFPSDRSEIGSSLVAQGLRTWHCHCCGKGFIPGSGT